VLTAERVKEKAQEIGFDLCGIAPAGAWPELAFFREWLARGHAGHMGYLPRTARVREDVRQILPSARSVVATATLYHTDRPLSVESADEEAAIVSRYAWGDDYHLVIGRRLEALVAWMRDQEGTRFEARPYVDTGPVQERVYAQYAGLGWIGKNTCLINPERGSWLFLGEIVTDLALQPDPPALDQCGACSLCLEACPTGALTGPGVLDATRCLSYLTIELKQAIPGSLREALGRHVYGCDICQDVCPWNQAAPASAAPEWQPRPGLDAPRLVDLWRRDDAGLQRLVDGTPMTRPRLTGLRRNLAVGMGNSRARSVAEELAAPDRPEDSPSRNDPMVREHLDWARRRIPKVRSIPVEGTHDATQD
jgi:epoxyqueuosine reductase